MANELGRLGAVWVLYKRELSAYMRSPLGWVIAAILLLVDGILFQSMALNRSGYSADVLATFFHLTAFVTAAIALALSVRLISEERQNQTLVLLNTAPIRDSEIVFGKFLAALTFLAFFLAMTLYLPLLIKVNGKITASQIAVGYVGLLLLGAATLAIGLFASALSRHQLIAFVSGLAMVVVMSLLHMLAERLDAPLREVVSKMDLFLVWLPQSVQSFKDGVLSLRDVVYYLAITYVFLLISVKTLEAKRWQ